MFSTAANGSYYLDPQAQSDLVDCLWTSANLPNWTGSLGYWFSRYVDEVQSLAGVYRPTTSANVNPLILHKSMVIVVNELHQAPGRSRTDLEAALSGAFARADVTIFERNDAIDACLRLLFMTTCRPCATNRTITIGQIFKPIWRPQESLDEFFARVFPKNCFEPGRGNERIHAKKLSATFLESSASVHIEWTNHLTDHLILETTADKKYLYLFRHSGFLEAVRKSTAVDASPSVMGCMFPKDLAAETLRSLELIFPQHDRRSRAILSASIKNLQADPHLESSQFLDRHHDHPQDALQPNDVSSLYRKFPHWGDRLYALWLDANDPAPVSKLGWWSESKKSPRFTYWAGVDALTIAVFFGLLASILSAVQVWITYCAWKNDPMSRGCRRL